MPDDVTRMSSPAANDGIMVHVCVLMVLKLHVCPKLCKYSSVLTQQSWHAECDKIQSHFRLFS